jgi:hypothetical protein
MPIRVKAVGKPSMIATTISASMRRPSTPEVGLAQVSVEQIAPRRQDEHRDHDQGHEPEAEPQLLADDHRGLSLVT